MDFGGFMKANGLKMLMGAGRGAAGQTPGQSIQSLLRPPMQQYTVGEDGPENLLMPAGSHGYVMPNPHTEMDPQFMEAHMRALGGPVGDSDSEEERRRQLLRRMVLGAQQQAPPDQEAGPVTSSPVPQGTPTGLARVASGPPSVTMMPSDANMDELSAIGQASAAGQRYGPQPPRLTGSRAAKANAEAYGAAEALPVNGFWRRLGHGLNNGLQTWRENGAQGGIVGLAGSLAGGGAYGAVAPHGIAQWDKDRQLAQLWNTYGQEIQKEGVEEQRKQGIIKTQKAGIDLQQAAAEPYIKAASAKGYMTPDEVDHIKNTFGVDVTDPNNGRFQTDQRNGKTYIRRINEPVSTEDVTLPAELGNQYYNTSLPGQTQQVPLKPGQVATTSVGIANANAGREERAGNRAAQVEEKNYESESQFKTRQGKARSDAASAQASLDSLNASRVEAVNNGVPTSSIDARIAAAKGQLAAANSSLREKFTPRPSLTAKTLSEAEFRSRYGQGRTEAEIQAAISKGRANGLIR